MGVSRINHTQRVHGHTLLQEQRAAEIFVGQRSLDRLFPGLTANSTTQATLSAGPNWVLKSARCRGSGALGSPQRSPTAHPSDDPRRSLGWPSTKSLPGDSRGRSHRYSHLRPVPNAGLPQMALPPGPVRGKCPDAARLHYQCAKRLDNRLRVGGGQCLCCGSFLDRQLEHTATCSTAEATRVHFACVHAVVCGMKLADPDITTECRGLTALQSRLADFFLPPLLSQDAMRPLTCA